MLPRPRRLARRAGRHEGRDGELQVGARSGEPDADASSTKILLLLANINEQHRRSPARGGDAKAALASYQAELEFGRRAAAIDPKSATARYVPGSRPHGGWARTTACSAIKRLCWRVYDASTEIFRELAAEDPTSTDYQYQLALGLEAMGVAQARRPRLRRCAPELSAVPSISTRRWPHSIRTRPVAADRRGVLRM